MIGFYTLDPFLLVQSLMLGHTHTQLPVEHCPKLPFGRVLQGLVILPNINVYIYILYVYIYIYVLYVYIYIYYVYIYIYILCIYILCIYIYYICIY